MAVVRMIGKAAHLYTQYVPAVLWLIKYYSDSADCNGIWVESMGGGRWGEAIAIFDKIGNW